MATCKYCKEAIKSGAKKCPHCGSNDPVGESFVVIAVLVVAAIMVVGFIIDVVTKIFRWIGDHIWQIIGYPALFFGVISLYFALQYHSSNKEKYSNPELKNGAMNRFFLTSLLIISGFLMSFVFGGGESTVLDNEASSDGAEASYNGATDGAITVTVAKPANVRNIPSSKGSDVIETLSPGTNLTGEWVQGSNIATERWLKVDKNGSPAYIWEGNLLKGD